MLRKRELHGLFIYSDMACLGRFLVIPNIQGHKKTPVAALMSFGLRLLGLGGATKERL